MQKRLICGYSMRLVLTILLFAGSTANTYSMKDENISVLELRNYLLKPNTSNSFRKLFNDRFVTPMWEFGGYAVGQFAIDGDRDRFVWLRGYENIQTRLKFLNDFYLNSEVWKIYKNDANSMIVNSDNVYLLRPLAESGDLNEGEVVRSADLQKEKAVLVVDFYVCNSRLEPTIDLFKKEYLPFLKASGVSDISLWVSEMSKNEFPRLPAFQDENLLVTMTAYQSQSEYKSKTKKIDAPDAVLKNAMFELITTRHRLVLFPTQERNS